MIEVEAKIKIANPDFFRKKASSLGKFRGNEKKIDDYYTLEPTKSYPKKSLRVRRRKGFYEINFKQRLSFINGMHAKKEVEFKVSDIPGFLSLIRDFGFRKWLRKEKTTEIYEISKNFHIEINNIKNLGWFIELEHLVENKDKINQARTKILKVLHSLGISDRNLVKEGYTKMLWDKMH